MEQKTFNKADVVWRLLPYPRNESFVKLEVGEEFKGIYVSSKPNPNFKDEKIHVFEDDEGNVRQMNGTANLDRWLSVVDPGSYVKVVRVKDKKIGQPKPLQVFEVYVPESEGSWGEK
jgi:hypothetical protein